MRKLATLTRGRPLMLGKLDEKVKKFLVALRREGGAVNTVVAITAAQALIQESNKEHLKLTDLEKSSQAKSLFQRIEFTKNSSSHWKARNPRWSSKRSCTNFSPCDCFQNRKISNTTLANIEY